MSQAARIQRHLERLPAAMQDEVLDFVLFLEQRAATGERGIPDAERALRVSRALESLTALNPFSGVDPQQWQRDARADRTLAGRD